jgi:hypothetical protein
LALTLEPFPFAWDRLSSLLCRIFHSEPDGSTSPKIL